VCRFGCRMRVGLVFSIRVWWKRVFVVVVVAAVIAGG